MKTTKRHRYRMGLWSERFVALWYRLKGFRILGRRLRTPVGEIDVLALKGSLLMIIEVKYRRTETVDGVLTPHQQMRLHRAAAFVLQSQWRQQKRQDLHVCFDLVLVRPWKWPQRITY